MPKNLKIFSALKNKLKTQFGENLLDIIIFGSTVKGKSNPNDIDIAVILKNEVNQMQRKKVDSIIPDGVHLSYLKAANFFNEFHSLSRSLLYEGRSLLSRESLAQRFGLITKAIYSYDLSDMSLSKKVRFVFALRGRKGQEGLIAHLGGSFLNKSTFMVPIEKDYEMIEIFEVWGVRYQRWKVMLMD